MKVIHNYIQILNVVKEKKYGFSIWEHLFHILACSMMAIEQTWQSGKVASGHELGSPNGTLSTNDR